MKINYDHIQKAMEDIRRDRFDYYLDLTTGEVKQVPIDTLKRANEILYTNPEEEYEPGVVFDSEVNLDVEMDENTIDSIEEVIEILLNSNRFVRIPERDSADAFKTMRDFAETVKDEALKKSLINALNGKGAFRRFKDALLADKKERKRWHGYNALHMKKVIKRWLQGLTIL
ncbi:MAG: hypothetical protein GXO99_04315 [Nitrospirae bacterium]|nr:hypothetical protein [Nitrospirota bacterium]